MSRQQTLIQHPTVQFDQRGCVMVSAAVAHTLGNPERVTVTLVKLPEGQHATFQPLGGKMPARTHIAVEQNENWIRIDVV